ncbi:hypothetical protein MSG_02565 [Mycobacterium shigaense]|uniref:Uncharacterized protein n=1 Tax=Mycobacterium shigaense TaxID=722731 RepID=A0A1Z4EIA6_9MYCO|nr:hypothetical protein MSG_02565 [Mycobacterium shigaense]
MESKIVEPHLTGAAGAPVSGSTKSSARLAALGYTFITTGGARR